MSVTTDVKPATTRSFSWSYSTLKNYETCPRRFYHYDVIRDVREPESDAIKYGHSVHAAFAARVGAGAKLPLGMGMYEPLLAQLAQAPGKVHTEQKLALTSALAPTVWSGNSTWFRIVIDYANLRDDGTATVLDYKTGRVAQDDTQLALSAAVLFAHDQNVQRVKAGLVFVAHDQVERAEYVREQTAEIWSEILPRVRHVAQARQTGDYPPKPGGLCRKYCAVRSCSFNGR